ncbi:hypothetical protein [Aliagarivorans taiwanensis]|uniref:hypothetical protein n=1 Tax=Aliagarivorans taiwanensis TaxID=561966 RepID=UPI00040E95CB|nr:hypothetical protein [Aliagarivorans taiwanensis]
MSAISAEALINKVSEVVMEFNMIMERRPHDLKMTKAKALLDDIMHSKGVGELGEMMLQSGVNVETFLDKSTLCQQLLESWIRENLEDSLPGTKVAKLAELYYTAAMTEDGSGVIDEVKTAATRHEVPWFLLQSLAQSRAVREHEQINEAQQSKTTPWQPSTTPNMTPHG